MFNSLMDPNLEARSFENGGGSKQMLRLLRREMPRLIKGLRGVKAAGLREESRPVPGKG
jgi:hypothetical protein